MRRFVNFAPTTRFFSDKKPTARPVILVHGGVTDHPDKSLFNSSEKAVQIAAFVGYNVLARGGSALDAVYEAIQIMEVHPKFNSPLEFGLIIDKKLKMDAAVMCGVRMKSASINQINNILHPIAMARKVMDQSMPRHLDGETASKYAVHLGFVTLNNTDTLVTPQSLQDLKSFENNLSVKCGAKGTVGAVAVDMYGNVAAASVSGGGVGEVTGRVGDAPLIGSGIFADNAVGAVSFTVEGDRPVNYNAAKRVIALMQMQQNAPQEAVEVVVEQLKGKFCRNFGAVCVDNQGRIGIHYTGGHLTWAYRQESELCYGLHRDQNTVRLFN